MLKSPLLLTNTYSTNTYPLFMNAIHQEVYNQIKFWLSVGGWLLEGNETKKKYNT